MTDDQFRIKSDIITHTRHFIVGDLKTYTKINASRQQLQTWFEYLFTNEMNWADKNWQVDHVIPLSFFDLTQDGHLKLACHWSNMRPMSEQGNRAKGDTIVKETIFEHLNIVKSFIEIHGDYQANVETCWWQRLELWYGKNEQDEEKFEDFLKWIIRSQVATIAKGSTTKW